MAAVLPEFVPPWRAICFRGSLGGFPGEVQFEQQMQAVAAIGGVQQHNETKGWSQLVLQNNAKQNAIGTPTAAKKVDG